MKNILVIINILSCLACADNYIDTGISNGKHDCSMYDYFLTDSYNWDSTRLVIERAGLKYMFDGTDEAYKNITFFGPTNHSIRAWMLNNDYKQVADIPADICADFIKKYVYKEAKMMRKDFEFEIKGTNEGGTKLIKLDGGEIRVYRRSTDWGSAVGAGPEELYVQSYAFGVTVRVASADIETLTGIVHSLSYTHTFGNF
ncbi:MAG: hypothetical protein SOY65_06775 [Marinifilaceae bacterium]|nr:hypothetical protein [Marinifilaceae bacterium]